MLGDRTISLSEVEDFRSTVSENIRISWEAYGLLRMCGPSFGRVWHNACCRSYFIRRHLNDGYTDI